MKTPAPLNLLQVFEKTQTHDYVVMKSLPNGSPEFGSDIDLLCAETPTLGKQFLRNCQPLIKQGYEVRVRELLETRQVHIDLMLAGRIALRLDMHDGLGVYQRVPIKETFAQRIIERRGWASVSCPAGELRLAVPDVVDNLVLRYLEYHEWFDRRPDKIRHADYIAEQFNVLPQTTRLFYDRLMEATSQRPSQLVLRYCDLNIKRQFIWSLWSVRDKLAWRLDSPRRIAVMAFTQPVLFASKLAHRLTPSTFRLKAITHKNS